METNPAKAKFEGVVRREFVEIISNVANDAYTPEGAEESIRFVNEAAEAYAQERVREALESMQEFVVAHTFDTTVGRRIDDELTQRIKALESNGR